MKKMIRILAVVFAMSFTISGQNRQWYPPWPPSSLAKEWEFSTDEQNRLTMRSFFPYGAVDRHLTLIIDSMRDKPVGGSALHPGGFSRELKKGDGMIM